MKTKSTAVALENLTALANSPTPAEYVEAAFLVKEDLPIFITFLNDPTNIVNIMALHTMLSETFSTTAE